MAQIVVALLFLAHGVGHLLFLANSWGIWKSGAARATLFENVLHAGQVTEGIAGVFWLIPLVGFAFSAWGYYSDTAWWRTAALGSGLLSVALIVVFWNSLNRSSVFFALVVDVAIVIVLLWQQSQGVVGAAQ